MSKKLTTDEFILKAKDIHGEKYLYKNVSYKNSRTKVNLFCTIHNTDFSILPYAHLQGNGCPNCSQDKRTKSNTKYNLSEFLCISTEKHNGKYDYEKVSFNTLSDKVVIICAEHGEFSQQANLHMGGRQCPKCAKISMANKNRLSIDEIIAKCNKVHGFKYDYSKFDKVVNNDKVIIVCPTHGEFSQALYSHKSGTGCPKCSNERRTGNALKTYMRNNDLGNEVGLFYVLKFKHVQTNIDFIKIGITRQTLEQRYNLNGIYKEFTYDVLYLSNTTNLDSAIQEDYWKIKLKPHKFKFPENLKFKGYTECYDKCVEEIILSELVQH